METADEYECDWLPPMTLPAAITEVKGAKDFMLCFFPFFGTFETHERDFKIPLIAESLNKCSAATGLVPVFIGGRWELEWNPRRHELMQKIPNAIDLVGQTSLREVFGLLQGCRMITGYHSGIPNVGAAFGRPTVLLWDERYPVSTSYACMPPAVRDTTYHPLRTRGLTVDAYVERLERTC